MDNFINRFKEVVSVEMIVVFIAIAIGIVAISLIVKSMRVKKAKKELDALESTYTELKNIPLSFKLNKAQALAKVSKDADEKINEYQNEYDNAQENLKNYSSLLAEIDDLVFSKKIKKVNEKIEKIIPIVNESEKSVNELNKKLDAVLEQENTQRENINALKEQFRNDKNSLLNNRSSYQQSIEYLDGMVTDIENMFSVFEEWMFASEFNKAADKQNDIKGVLVDFERYLSEIPNFYESCKVTIPAAIEELEYLYETSKQKGVYLDHLEVIQHLDVVKDLNNEILNKLTSCNIESVNSDIDDCETRLVELKESIDKEVEAFDSIHEKVNNLFERIKNLNVNIQRIKDTYSRVYERFGFENWNEKLVGLDEKLDSLNEQRFRLEKVISDNAVPYTTLLISADELDMDTKKLEDDALDMSDKLNQACSDEERAKKQLIKLQMIINEVRVKIIKNHLPSVSDKYDDDLIKASTLITEVKNILGVTPLDVDSLNVKLQEAIDYIYTLYNSVNNLVGMAIMVENAIVFGNKYRSEFPEVDSELTRAELCFTNGQYTKSLKIAIAIIEKLHPGAYENLIEHDGATANG